MLETSASTTIGGNINRLAGELRSDEEGKHILVEVSCSFQEEVRRSSACLGELTADNSEPRDETGAVRISWAGVHPLDGTCTELACASVDENVASDIRLIGVKRLERNARRSDDLNIRGLP